MSIFANTMEEILKKKKGLIDFPTSDETPFIMLDEIIYRAFFTKEKVERLVNLETGEERIYKTPSEKKEGFKDSSKYTKLFKGGKLKLAELSSAGTKVLCYIMLNSKPNEEEICLRPTLVAKEMGYRDQRSVYEGLVDLLNTNLIARKTGYGNCFWINPNLFFNGDRTKLLDKPVRYEFREVLMQEHHKRLKDWTQNVKAK